MDPLIYIAAAAFVAIVLLAVTLLFRNQDQGVDDGGQEAQEPLARPRPVAADVARAGGRRRVRQRMVRRQEDESDEEDEMNALEDIALPEGKVGAKKMAKLQAKAEKRANREAEIHEREERKKREEKLENTRRKDEAREANLEKQLEEQEAERKKEQEAREEEEYLKMKAMFSVDEEGTQEEELNQDTESLLQEFIRYIKEMKVIMLEDLAAHFKIRTQDAIDRVTSLLDDGTIQGVLDDRGKFIYVTQEEFEAVSRFIKQRGRVSITELAESSNRLINLKPDNTAALHQLVGTAASL